MNRPLKMRIIDSGEKQIAICRRLEISESLFSRIVNGWVTPCQELKEKIAKALNGRVQDLFQDGQNGVVHE